MHPIGSQARGAGEARPLSALPAADAARIADTISQLRDRTVPGHPYTRRSFTPTYADARRWLAAAMRATGLEPSIDAAGNLVGRLAAGRPDGGLERTVLIGSHIDTVPGGGAYDGVAGVAAGLEIARLIRAAGIVLPFALEVVDFLAEEP